MHDKQFQSAIIIIKYIFLIFILMMAPNSHHLIQISIVEEYRIFRTINLDKNDDFVYSIPLFCCRFISE